MGGTVQTGVAAVDALLDDCRTLATALFGERLRGIYLIGSLAHGGFAAAVSDIDLALLLRAPLAPDDADHIAALASNAASNHPDYGRRLSVFWSTPDAFAGADQVQVPGRFPALDRLDLTSHGRLFAGDDLRASLTPPSRRAILEHSRIDLLRFMHDPVRARCLEAGEDCPFHDRKALTRVCLFPARFLYTARTLTVASNDVAVASYRERHQGTDNAIVELGLALRQQPERPLHSDERAFLSAELPAYYCRFLREFLTLLGAAAPAETALPDLLAAIEAAPIGG